MHTIDVLVSESDSDGDDIKGGIGRAAAETVLKRLPVDSLQRNMRDFVHSLSAAFSDIGSLGQDYHLREVALQIELTAAGGVVLIGTAKVEGSASISLRFAK